MAISTYSELKTAVADWLRRPSIASRIPDFITLCETDMQRRLNVGDQELSTTLTTTPNVTTVALPAGFTKLRRLRYLWNGQYYDLWPVALAPSDSANWNVASNPLAVSIVGSNLVIRPTPNAAYQMPMEYYGKFTPLSDAAPTNWILTDNPDAYLYGTLMHSAPYLGTDTRLGLWEGAYQSAIEGINRADFRKRFSSLQRQTDLAPLVNRQAYNINRGW